MTEHPDPSLRRHPARTPKQVAGDCHDLERLVARGLAESYAELYADAHRRPQWSDFGGGHGQPGGSPVESAWQASVAVRANVIEAGELVARALACWVGAQRALERAWRALADSHPQTIEPADDRLREHPARSADLRTARAAQRRRRQRVTEGRWGSTAEDSGA